MTIAVDTNALLALIHDDHHADAAEKALRTAYTEGPLVITPVVYAETAADGQFSTTTELSTFLDDLSIDVAHPSPEALFRSGEAFSRYSDRRPDGLQCPECGTKQVVNCSECEHTLAPRQHIAADFLIGGHAVMDAEALVTFDAGFYGSYFPNLAVRPAK
ncbi:type II toxin-antitoxin system VapC family toxin [Halococcus hamelinensis]|uniref:Nucleic acid-binding protein n=1 Tax=Halococcus hamelinensis 100A6 TaxID=1132509 RepID=M0LX85_9EURY|nr:type II toxin-antitoxin system VapC family toxin [Halococcus hamelinensis]EMA37788.1 nucleic acid-binding protein [Halococcus hamelinensis 100A6]